MKKIYIKSFFFWFVLLVLTLINATIREAGYKPILEPYIGLWAHQISSLTGILLFFIAIYFFLKRNNNYNKKDLIFMGIIWFVMTIAFETLMNVFMRNLNFKQVLQTYYFWQGEIWVFVLLSLLILPFVVDKILNKKINNSLNQ